MISERVLRKWRKEALEGSYPQTRLGDCLIEQSKRILQLTQELLDQHLLRGKSNDKFIKD